jgi:hypothetical protein
MKKMRKEHKKLLFGSTMTAFLIVGAITGAMIMTNILAPEVMRSWRPVSAEANPGEGASGMLEIYIYPHAATPATTYNANLSTDDAYAYGEAWDGSLTGNVPYDTAFDIVIKVRFNTTHAYNSTASDWDMDYIQAIINSTDLSITPNQLMDKIEITNNTEYIWVHFYFQDDGGSGFTYGAGETVTVDEVRLQAYF